MMERLPPGIAGNLRPNDRWEDTCTERTSMAGASHAMATLAVGRQLSEFFSGWSVRAVPGEPVLLIDLATVEERMTRIIFDMYRQQDLVFVAW